MYFFAIAKLLHHVLLLINGAIVLILKRMSVPLKYKVRFRVRFQENIFNLTKWIKKPLR